MDRAFCLTHVVGKEERLSGFARLSVPLLLRGSMPSIGRRLEHKALTETCIH
jgi:hypothetical protein